MRALIGNPFREAHGNAMRCYDWIAAPGTDPATLPTLIEAAVPGLKLECKTPTDSQNGFLLTSRLPDGSLYVSVCLHDAACAASDPNCTIEHGAHDIEAAPVLTPALEAKLSVKEHPALKLTKENAEQVFTSALRLADPLKGRFADG